MSIQLVNSKQIQPDVVILKEDSNINGQIIDSQVFPNEGSGPFGYSWASATREMSFNIGSANCALQTADTCLEFDVIMGTTTAKITEALMLYLIVCEFLRILELVF